MNSTESQLLGALRELETQVTTRLPGGPSVDLRPRLAELDRLARELPRDADPELVHFLQRRSYEKARLFLEGRLAEIQRGGCTRRGP